MKRNFLVWLPLLILGALLVAFWVGLKNPDDHIIASNMVGQPLPAFDTPPAFPDRPGASSADFADGHPRLLNVFASWCVPCVQEVGVLRQMRARGADITGIAIHDRQGDLARFLAENGDPYGAIGMDPEGRMQLAFGSTGVPETFVISGDGTILYQHIGVVSESDMPRLLAMLEPEQ